MSTENSKSRRRLKETFGHLRSKGRFSSTQDVKKTFGLGDEDIVVGANFQATDEELAQFIVCYYNGTDIEDSGLEMVKAFPDWGRGLLGLVNAVFFTYLTGLPERIEHRGPGIDWLDARAMGVPEAPPGTLRSSERAINELKTQRDKFRAAVSWLCNRQDSSEMGAVRQSNNFSAAKATLLEVRRMAAGIRDSVPSANDGTFLRYFQCHGITHCSKTLGFIGDHLWSHVTPVHIIDLFCAFLIEGAESGRPQMPVKLCAQCGDLFSLVRLNGQARARKQYCSATCQNKAFWGPRRTDFRYVERFAEYSDRRLYERLAQPKVQARLREIEERWPKWTGILDKIKDLRRRAARSADLSRKRSK